MTEEEYRQLLANQAAAQGASVPKTEQKRSHLTERKLAETCTNILVQDGWRPFRMEPISRRSWGKGFGEIGMPDYLYIRYQACNGARAEVLWIEYKIPCGVVAKHQSKWHSAERGLGALVIVATEDFDGTPDGFARWYSDSGLRRDR